MVLDVADKAGLLADLDPASRALLLSQAGDHAGCFFTVLPTAPKFNVPDPHFRVARVPLPFSKRVCPCRSALDVLGDHALGPRSVPLERTAARICREAGARVAENVLLHDLNLDAPVLDDRRLEVVANALPIWGGVQVAVDTTLVSPVRADGAPRPGADREPGLAAPDSTPQAPPHLP